MTTKRRELINALITGLSIEKDVYAIETIKESTEFLNESQYLDFYQTVMAENTYGNGVKAVMKVAEQFKPQQIDTTEIKAKELIQMVESINTKIGKDAERMGEDFLKLVLTVKLPGLSEEDRDILDSVKPYIDHKQLILNIRLYQTSEDTLKAFKQAIELTQRSESLAIGSEVRKMIGVRK